VLKGAIEKAQELVAELPNVGLLFNLFENPANIAAIQQTTAQEIIAAFRTELII
jgi:cysteine synthase